VTGDSGVARGAPKWPFLRAPTGEKKCKWLKKGQRSKMVKLRGKERRAWVFIPGAVLSHYTTDRRYIGVCIPQAVLISGYQEK